MRKAAPFIITFAIGAVFSSVVAFAWTGPTGTAPANNVAAPINVGSTDQTKSAGLGVNALSVFGNALLSGFGTGIGRYLNFDYSTDGSSGTGSSGYGIRDNAGVMEFKNNGASWLSLASIIQNYFAVDSSNTVGQIKFADGTTLTTASSTGGFAETIATICSSTDEGGVYPAYTSYGTAPIVSATCPSGTVTCPAGYKRTGCSGGTAQYCSYSTGYFPTYACTYGPVSVLPYGNDGCTCTSPSGYAVSSCTAYCAR